MEQSAQKTQNLTNKLKELSFIKLVKDIFVFKLVNFNCKIRKDSK